MDLERWSSSLFESLESIDPLGELLFVIGGTAQSAGMDRAAGARPQNVRRHFSVRQERLAPRRS
jgi:hypothetical protein